jgi:hypothetical protein
MPMRRFGLGVIAILLTTVLAATAFAAPPKEATCEGCHKASAPALVMEWEASKHAREGVGCLDCHAADAKDVDAWTHGGRVIATLVTPGDCAKCHDAEAAEFGTSHHAKAGEILASLDNILAEKVAGLPDNNADAVLGCWQCHGGIVKFKRDKSGNIVRAAEGRPVLDPTTWPNSGIGRLNPDGTKGSCNACHARHAFQAKVARSPENCGKCHLGPDHPQAEIYEESKHGIAFHAGRERMALDKDSWVLGKDYSAAPTCATCHTSAYATPNGEAKATSHDVGGRISWTLRPVVSTRLNRVVYADGYQEDQPESRPLPKVGDAVDTSEKVVVAEKMTTATKKRTVARVIPWQERRAAMKGVCANCHEATHVDNFYRQFDDLVGLYNDKFAKPAQALMDDLKKDGVLRAEAPFEHEVQWSFWELWHHEGRRARHGASMMGPDYTHWHGMYEVSKHYYTEFLPAVVEAAATKGEALAKKYREKVEAILAQPGNTWLKGLSPEEAEALRKEYKARYNQ